MEIKKKYKVGKCDIKDMLDIQFVTPKIFNFIDIRGMFCIGNKMLPIFSCLGLSNS